VHNPAFSGGGADIVDRLLHLPPGVNQSLLRSPRLLIVITAGRAANTTARRVPAHIPSSGTLEPERRYVLSPAPLILAAGDRQDLTAAKGQSPRTSMPNSFRRPTSAPIALGSLARAATSSYTAGGLGIVSFSATRPECFATRIRERS
jgi:hypothetical protein